MTNDVVKGSSSLRVALYARVSTEGQDPTPQLTRLRVWAAAEGHTVAIEGSEIASGRLVRRPLQERIIGEALARRVDAVAVVKVDRWARSMKHLSTTVEALHARGCAFYALDQGLAVRPGEATGELVLNVLGSVAQWEASIISERTKDALRAKVAVGIVGGRRLGAKRCLASHGCVRLDGHPGGHRVKGMPAATGENAPSTPSRVNDRLTPKEERA